MMILVYSKEACEILRSVIMCGARRCSKEMNGCAMACANYDTLSAIETAKSDSFALLSIRQKNFADFY
uniref:Uncharacterized protein n=1 Tax=Ascaris lumbricoides TaxID=6252 RepID=A0A0M3HMD0_ASCLU